jgi:peptidoglycan hydrolase-like protein with peptidoglycan-binding domain
MRRPPIRFVVLAVAVVATVGVGGALVAQSPTSASSPGAGPTSSATRLVAVVRTTLVATQPVSGDVTSSETWTVGLPAGATPDEVAAASDAAASAADQLAAARRSLTATTQMRTLIVARDDAAVAASPAGAARTEAVRSRSLDRIEQDGSVAMAQAVMADAKRAVAAANRELVAKRASEAAPGGTVTALLALGTTVARGEPLVTLDGRPTVLLIGTIPVYRALREGDVGPDVSQLQVNLVALGVAGTPSIRTDGTFDHATALAVRRWQSARHVEANGIVRLGDTIVLPAAVRIRAAHVAIGAAAVPGEPLLDVASVDEVVRLQVDPVLAPRIHSGDPIRFGAPDGSDIPGSIVSVAAPAISTQDNGNGPPGQLQVEVVAAAIDPEMLASLDGLQLTADVTTGTAPDALVVPVAALVVLADGNFGVEVATAGTTHFVRVTPGIYDRTLVEIKNDTIAPGDQVVVPAA